MSKTSLLETIQAMHWPEDSDLWADLETKLKELLHEHVTGLGDDDMLELFTELVPSSKKPAQKSRKSNSKPKPTFSDDKIQQVALAVEPLLRAGPMTIKEVSVKLGQSSDLVLASVRHLGKKVEKTGRGRGCRYSIPTLTGTVDEGDGRSPISYDELEPQDDIKLDDVAGEEPKTEVQ